MTNVRIRASLPLLALAAAACDQAIAPEDPAAGLPLFDVLASAPWTNATNLGPPVNTPCQEQRPALSRDELSLYFHSDRLGGFGTDLAIGCQDTNDIWVARRASLDAPWETPVNLGAVINTSANEFGPALSTDGHLLFFVSDRADPLGRGGNLDIYVSRRSNPNDDFGWGAPVMLGPDVNTADVEAGPAYLESGEAGRANLYFYRGEDNNLTTEIYRVAITRRGETLGPAVNVKELNWDGAPDGWPSIRKDGREIFFNSGRPGGLGTNLFDLWTSTRPSPAHPWSEPVPVGPPVNTTAAEFHPALSHDGRTMLFIAGGARGGQGRFDIWMVRR